MQAYYIYSTRSPHKIIGHIVLQSNMVGRAFHCGEEHGGFLYPSPHRWFKSMYVHLGPIIYLT